MFSVLVNYNSCTQVDTISMDGWIVAISLQCDEDHKPRSHKYVLRVDNMTRFLFPKSCRSEVMTGG